MYSIYHDSTHIIIGLWTTLCQTFWKRSAGLNPESMLSRVVL